MVLVLFFLGIFILISFLIILISVLSIQIDIKNLKFHKEDHLQKKINKDYEIIFYGCLFKKMKVFKYKLDNKKMPKKYLKYVNNKIDFSLLKSIIIKYIKTCDEKIIEIESLNLGLCLGTENVMLTSGIVTISNILISIFLPKLISNYNEEEYRYEVKPIYENKNKIDLFLESKIRIKLFLLIKAVKSYIHVRKIVALK